MNCLKKFIEILVKIWNCLLKITIAIGDAFCYLYRICKRRNQDDELLLKSSEPSNEYIK
jgi:hypothetical protein